MWNTIIFLALLLLPLQFSLGFGSGFDIAFGRVLIVGIFFLWILSSFRKRQIVFPSHVSFWLPVGFLFVAALSLSVAPHIDWGARKWVFLLNMFLWVFVVVSLLKQKKITGSLVAKSLAWAGGVAAAVGIGQFLLQYIVGLEGTLHVWRSFVAPIFLGAVFSEAVNEFPSWLVNIGGVTLFRAIGFFPDPHMLAFFLELAFPWALFLWIRERKRSIYGVLTLVMIVGIGLTFSRGAYLGVLIGGIISAFWILRIKRSISFARVAAIGSIIFLFLGGALLIDNPVRERLFDSSPFADTSTEGRLFLWSHAAGVFIKSPIFGTGLGNYPPTLEPSAEYRSPITAHNTYLDIAVEMGAFALLLWLCMIGVGARGYMQAYKKNILFGAGFVSLAMYAVHAFFDTSLYSVHVVPVWCTVIALGMYLHAELRKTEDNHAAQIKTQNDE